MRDLVCIPTYIRPEFLQLCLEHIEKADGGKDKHIIVAMDRKKLLDHRHSVQILETRTVIERFRTKFRSLEFIERIPHYYVGNVLNFMELYKKAFHDYQARYVYLIEDDVIVGQDFFRWHEAVQERADYFCSVGWHCIRNPKVLPSNDQFGIVESARDFSSIGVCWKRENLEKLASHAQMAYYIDLSSYMRNNFPDSLVPHTKWTEQAGLITRLLLESGGKFIAWPCQRRCAHVGISGYHRPNGHVFSGALDRRVEELRNASKSTEVLLSKSTEIFDDISSLAEVLPWTPEQLYVAQRIPYDGTYE